MGPMTSAPAGKTTKAPKGKIHVLIIGIHPPAKSLGKKNPKSNKKSA